MARFMNVEGQASNAGNVPLSKEKLRALDPGVFKERTFKCDPYCPEDHPAEEMRVRFAEQLEFGDSRAALVMATSPLVVAAYSDELDAVVLLRFPPAFVSQYRLEVGSRLVTVNSYRRWTGKKSGNLLYPPDMVVGPQQLNRYSSFLPLIADFLTEDSARLEELKRNIDESEWARTRELGRQRIAVGLDTARSGKPTESNFPYERAGMFLVGPDAPGAKSRMGLGRALLLFVLGVLLIVAGRMIRR